MAACVCLCFQRRRGLVSRAATFLIGLAQLLLAAFSCRSDRSGLVSREFLLEMSVRMSQSAKSPVRFRLALGSVSVWRRFFFGNFRQSLAGGQITGPVSARFRLAFGSLSARSRFAFGSVSARFGLALGSLLCTEPSQVHLWFAFGSLLLGADRFRATFGSLSARFRLTFGPSMSSLGPLSVRFRLAFGSVLE